MTGQPIPAGHCRCELCHDDVPTPMIADHLRLMHGCEPVHTWPDGNPVVVDSTLTPADFTDTTS